METENNAGLDDDKSEEDDDENIYSLAEKKKRQPKKTKLTIPSIKEVKCHFWSFNLKLKFI